MPCFSKAHNACCCCARLIRLTRKKPSTDSCNRARPSVADAIEQSTEENSCIPQDRYGIPFHKGCTDVGGQLHSVDLSQYEDHMIHSDVDTVFLGLGLGRGVDVDAWVALCDESLSVMDTVRSDERRSICGSIVHSGDNPVEEGSAGDAQISVDLPKIPPCFHYVVFVVSFPDYDAAFDQADSAYVRILRSKAANTNHELCRFTLSNTLGPAMLMGALIKKDLCWNFRALGLPVTGSSILELLEDPENLNCLRNCLSFDGKRNKAVVNVVRGIDLPLKESCSFTETRIVSSPYCRLSFGDKEVTSDHISGSPMLQWEIDSFEVQWSPDAEKLLLVVEVFDFNPNGSDDSVGVAEIQGSELFTDMGRHEKQSLLESSKVQKHKNQRISGRGKKAVRSLLSVFRCYRKKSGT